MFDKLPVIPAILRQHVEGAAFLWSQRSGLFYDPAMGAVHLGRHDLRLRAHLSACMASGQETLHEAERRFADFPKAGEIFAWLTLALSTGDERVTHILDHAGQTSPIEWRGASGAVAWVGVEALKPYVVKWSKSDDPFRRWLAVCAFSHYRTTPGQILDGFLNDPSPLVRARSLRLLGELGLTTRLSSALEALETSEEAGQRFFGARSALLLGERTKALAALRSLAEQEGRYADAALELVVLADQTPQIKIWMGQMIRNDKRRDSTIEMSGASDDPEIRDWLLSNCANPNYAAAVTLAMRNALPFDVDDTNILEGDPEVMGPEFAGRDDGPWAVEQRVRDALKAHQGAAVFVNLPTLRRRALSAAINAPTDSLEEWRGAQRCPAWS